MTRQNLPFVLLLVVGLIAAAPIRAWSQEKAAKTDSEIMKIFQDYAQGLGFDTSRWDHFPANPSPELAALIRAYLEQELDPDRFRKMQEFDPEQVRKEDQARMGAFLEEHKIVSAEEENTTLEKLEETAEDYEAEPDSAGTENFDQGVDKDQEAEVPAVKPAENAEAKEDQEKKEPAPLSSPESKQVRNQPEPPSPTLVYSPEEPKASLWGDLTPLAFGALMGAAMGLAFAPVVGPAGPLGGLALGLAVAGLMSFF